MRLSRRRPGRREGACCLFVTSKKNLETLKFKKKSSFRVFCCFFQLSAAPTKTAPPIFI